MITEQLINDAKKYALKEIELYGTPVIEHFEISNLQGQLISKKLKADQKIVLLGTILMDLKLGEAFKNNILEKHVNMSD